MTKERWLRITRPKGLTITEGKRLRMAERACFGLTIQSIIEYHYL